MNYSLNTKIKKDLPLVRTARKTAIAALVLIVLLAVAGVVYVYISDRSIKPKANPTPTHAVDNPPIKPPPKPAPNAAENASIQSLISPVNPGQNSSIIVHTDVTSTCTISVTYNNVPSTDSGLTAKPADAYGNVTWTWTVPANAPLGTWPVKVTCVYNGRSGVVIGNLQVAKGQTP